MNKFLIYYLYIIALVSSGAIDVLDGWPSLIPIEHKPHWSKGRLNKLGLVFTILLLLGGIPLCITHYSSLEALGRSVGKPLLFITGVFLASGGLSYLLVLGGAMVRELDHISYYTTPFNFGFTFLGVIGLLVIHRSANHYRHGETERAKMMLIWGATITIVTFIANYVLFIYSYTF